MIPTTQPTKEILYVGTYTEKGEGIYVYEFDRISMSFNELQVVPAKCSPSFLEFHPNRQFVYAANEGNGTVSSYRIDPQNGKLTELNTVSSHGDSPCHASLSPRGKYLYISNYSSGNMAVYRINQDGSIGELTDAVQSKGTEEQTPHMHSVIPLAHGKFIYASDLGIDKILIFQTDEESGKLVPGAIPYAQLQPCDGPRHLVFDPLGHFAYSACELSSSITAFAVKKETGALAPIERISMLPDDFSDQSYAADIHMSTDGQFLYASNRGHDSIVRYKVDKSTGRLKVLDYTPTLGKHPRNFSIDSTGTLLFVANRDDDNVVLFYKDNISGKLSYSGKQLSIPTPVYVKLIELDVSHETTKIIF